MEHVFTLAIHQISFRTLVVLDLIVPSFIILLTIVSVLLHLYFIETCEILSQFCYLFSVLEIATNDFGNQNERLLEKIVNGKNQEFREVAKVRMHNLQLEDASVSSDTLKLGKKSKIFSLSCGTPKYCKRDDRYSTSFLRQFWLLMMRTFLILKRDKSLTSMRFLIHCLIAPLIGVLYFDIGNNANEAFNNFNYIFFSIMFLMYTAFSSMTMACKYILLSIYYI